MSVRKRKWTTNGDTREAWVVRYVDGEGKSRLKTFTRKHDADDYHTKVKRELRDGAHVPDRASITVAAAAQLWLNECDKRDLERSSMERNRRHVALHINPRIGELRLNQLTGPVIADFEDKLTAADNPARRSAPGIMVSLSAILNEARHRGYIAHDIPRRKRKLNERRKLMVGVDIPSPDEIKALIASLSGFYRPLIMTAIFTGLRSSELRGLRWADINLKQSLLHVRQRADAWNAIGMPKSKDSTRTVPLPPQLVAVLREWKLACPKGPLDLAFPSHTGNVVSHGQIVKRGLKPAMIAAGLVNARGRAKYPGLHALRHFFASWCMNRVENGGRGMLLKDVQTLLGHASVAMTADVYGHLFPYKEDSAALTAAASRFFS